MTANRVLWAAGGVLVGLALAEMLGVSRILSGIMPMRNGMAA